jgi:adenylate kinase
MPDGVEDEAPAGRPRRIVLLGPPASGKGTQGRRLAAYLGVPHISAGYLLRRSIEDGDPHGIAEEVAEGHRVPDAVVEEVLGPALGEGFVLDGYPRTARQAEQLDSLLADRGDPGVDRAVELDLDDGTLTVRMAMRAEEEKRSDDTPEVFFRRLEEYRRDIPAIRSYYDGRLVRIDSTGDEDEVFARLVNTLTGAATPA